MEPQWAGIGPMWLTSSSLNFITICPRETWGIFVHVILLFRFTFFVERFYEVSEQDAEGRYLEKSINDLRDVVTDGFKEINRKLENVVTRDLLTATVERIDADIESAKNSIDFVERNVEDKLDGLDEKIESSGARTRWVVGLAIVGAGVVSGIIFAIVELTMATP